MTLRFRHSVLLLIALLILGARQASAYEFIMLPANTLYPGYIADPYRPTFSAQDIRLGDSPAAGISDHRFDLKIGAPLVLFGWRAGSGSSSGERGYQFVIEAAFHGQFDANNSQDNTGWDGIYGFYGIYRPKANISFRGGIRHISSHIGDELIDSSGRTRIGYTRAELRAGMAVTLTSRLEGYLDAGYGYERRNDNLQDPWRIQGGLQYERPRRFWGSTTGWYAALDLSAYEENEWRRNIAVQGGLLFTAGTRRFRVGLEYYDGRGQIGEFMQTQEQYLGLGVWLDL